MAILAKPAPEPEVWRLGWEKNLAYIAIFSPDQVPNLRVQIWQKTGPNPEVRVQVQAQSAQTHTEPDRRQSRLYSDS